ncbi:PepSY domain-containing protein [Pseudomonas sp. AA-38]|uniref:PepSY domain-containing protein n=1 Tax=Pseudomonas sp. AA-38 TaxID=3028807 RepID=UPI0023F7488F|nr:PepSY domain-containing protein [Pseudomonas sp. AA-38]
MTHASAESSRTVPAAVVRKRRSFLYQAFLALFLGFAALSSLADDDCDVPISLWQSREAVREMAASQGWHLRRLKIDDGCYEIKGTDAQGRAFKAKLDPQTLAIVKFKYKDHDGKHSHRSAEAPMDASHAHRSGNPPPESMPATPRDPID